MRILLQAEGFIPLLNAEGTYLEDIWQVARGSWAPNPSVTLPEHVKCGY
jgi:hypothetical protein